VEPGACGHRREGRDALDQRVFFTSLYHALLHPNVFEDVDRRYLGFDGQVHAAADHVHYANFSMWDTYKSQNQLLATAWPERYRDMALSLLDDFAEGGKLPRWGEQGFDAGHMSGDPAIPLLADAACRGLLSDSALASAVTASLDLVSRRPAELASLGYLPGRPGTTLEYGVADFALALLARRAGAAASVAPWVSEDALARSHNWRNTFDASVGWVRPRNADGTWAGGEPFDPTAEEGFQEGNSWQYSWLAPHDSAALFSAMGGVDVARGRLDQLFAAPAEVQTKLTGFGTVYRAPQYAPGNEHDLQVPWMYAFAGRPDRVGDELADVQQVFRPTVDGMPGNADLGGRSSWQVFSVLGFGPVVPGAPLFVVGSSPFTSVTVGLGGGAFTVKRSGVGSYVQSARLNGNALDASWFSADKVRPGGSLELVMGLAPSGWGTGAGDVPPSSAASADALGAFGCE
jgi:predicted alpha-1,2-mannosidase